LKERGGGGAKRACWSFAMGTRTNDKRVNYSYPYAQTKQQVWLVHNLNIFGA